MSYKLQLTNSAAAAAALGSSIVVRFFVYVWIVDCHLLATVLCLLCSALLCSDLFCSIGLEPLPLAVTCQLSLINFQLLCCTANDL